MLLKDIKFDENIFSGIPGKSYIDNGLYHTGSKYVIAMDISKFFPNIGREKVYSFFRDKLKNSGDIAEILTNLCTIDLNEIPNLNISVIEYIKENNIKRLRHIPTGSSISCIMSYLANIDMFNEIENIAQINNCKVSIYVDDIVLSSDRMISKKIVNKITSIIRMNGYKVQKNKLKWYLPNEYKRITGNVLSKDGSKLVIPNKIRHRIEKLKKNKGIELDKKTKKLEGYKNLITQIIHQKKK